MLAGLSLQHPGYKYDYSESDNRQNEHSPTVKKIEPMNQEKKQQRTITIMRQTNISSQLEDREEDSRFELTNNYNLKTYESRDKKKHAKFET